jgi:hypothetical protein
MLQLLIARRSCPAARLSKESRKAHIPADMVRRVIRAPGRRKTDHSRPPPIVHCGTLVSALLTGKGTVVGDPTKAPSGQS